VQTAAMCSYEDHESPVVPSTGNYSIAGKRGHWPASEDILGHTPFYAVSVNG